MQAVESAEHSSSIEDWQQKIAEFFQAGTIPRASEDHTDGD